MSRHIGIALFFVFFFCALSPTLAIGPRKEPARTIYISSSTGNDDNPGTMQAPRRTIASLTKEERSGSTILLRRGDTFFEGIRNFSDCRIGAYGSGYAPLLCGFRILVKPKAWKKVKNLKNVWEIDLRTDKNFIGVDKSREWGEGTLYNIGCIYRPDADAIFGQMVAAPDSLLRDGQFFVSSVFRRADVKPDTFSILYLRSKKNPKDYGTLCFSTYLLGIDNATYCIIQDINVMGFATHGAGGDLTGTHITHCGFDVIGGAVQLTFATRARFGNGVEAWSTGMRDMLVDYCTFSRTYDCATTIQASGPDAATAVNIKFLNNKMTHCRQAFEFFLFGKPGLSFQDCEFSGNIAYMMGDNGFSCPEPRDADFLSWGPTSPPIPVRNNLLFGASYFYTENLNPLMGFNTVYIYPSQYLVEYPYRRDTPIPASDPSLYRRRSPRDNSVFTIVTPGSEQDISLRRQFEDSIGWKAPRLPIGR